MGKTELALTLNTKSNPGILIGGDEAPAGGRVPIRWAGAELPKGEREKSDLLREATNVERSSYLA